MIKIITILLLLSTNIIAANQLNEEELPSSTGVNMTKNDFILKNKNGDVFLDLLRIPESEATSLKPLTHSLIVAIHNGAGLIINNREKGYWEIAGGMIDQGETPRQCAVRELDEESNQRVSLEDAEYLGVMKFDLVPDRWNKANRIEYGTLYRVKLTKIKEFIPNAEAAAINFWNGSNDIGEIDEIDKKLVEIALGNE